MTSSLRRAPRVNRARASWWLASLAPLAILAVPSSASAFCRTTTTPVPPTYSPTKGCFTDGLPLYWKNACVSYSLNAAASARIPYDTAKPLLDQAFATWSTATCPATGANVGIAASPTAAVTCDKVNYNTYGPNQNVIVFRDDGWPYNDPYNTLGLTTVTFNADNGEIYDADMEINSSGKNLTVGDPVPAKGFDLLSVLTHEAGHFLGLAHATNPTSTMYASYKEGTSTLRTLTQDDIDGLCTIYPDAKTRNVATTVSPTGLLAADTCDATPRHGFGTTCEANPAPQSSSSGCAAAPSTPANGSVVAAAVAALVVLRRRREPRARR